MKKSIVISALAFVFIMFAVACHAKDPGMSGAELFKQHCAPCHSGGGNVIEPAYTLHKKDLKEHGITKPKDVIAKMRNPGPGMTAFDRNTISDSDAEKIGEYVLKTF